MIIRTTSQLPPCETPVIGDLFEVSHQSADRYTSQSLSYGSLQSSLTQSISSIIGNTFGLYGVTSAETIFPHNVDKLTERVNALSSQDIVFSGRKTFTSVPKIVPADPKTAYISADGNSVPNITKVKDLIDERSCFIADSYKIDADPGNDSTPPMAVDSDQFMHWHIDDNGTDSTQWMDPSAKGRKTQADGVMCQHTGFLTIYGWLADNGQPLPQDCWVGLYGRINVINEKTGEINPGKWVMLQVQPWVRGVYASKLQYVSFSLPVSAGLWLKIKTGFNVNGHVGGFQDSRSLTYSLNQPNSFTGYIIRAED